jgi:hypothetical protein
MGLDAAAGAAKGFGNASLAEQRLHAAETKQFREAIGNIEARGKAAWEQAQLLGNDNLPEHFSPIRAVRSLPKLGRWRDLDDKWTPYFPIDFQHLIRRISASGDQDAVELFKVLGAALGGEAEKQAAMGEILERGLLGAQKDIQRAFFFYYRAALQGNEAAKNAALRLKRSTAISPLTMQEPELIHDGEWQVVVDVFQQDIYTFRVALKVGGTLTGSLLNYGGAKAEAISSLLSSDPAYLEFTLGQFKNMTLDGRWTYDQATFKFHATVRISHPMRGVVQGTETWDVELLGTNDSTLFGRDKNKVNFTFTWLSGK